jgi:chromosome segregation ATPase
MHAPSYHNVTGSLLLDLNKTDIIEDLKVDKFGQRQTLMEEIEKLRKRMCRGAAAGRSAGGAPRQAGSSADELAMLEKKKADRLKAQLDALKRKVSHARDAEARAKVLARQAEGKAGEVEKALESIEEKLKQRKAAPPMVIVTALAIVIAILIAAALAGLHRLV